MLVYILGVILMDNYKEMYITLFKAITKTIFELQKAQQQTEEIFISDGSANLTILEQHKKAQRNQTKER